MKKIISLVCAMVLIVSLVGCGPQAKPDTVVTTFCDAMKAYDRETMSSCVASGGEDLTEETETKAEDELTNQIFDYLKICTSKMTYSIQNSKVNEDKGTVTVKFKYVDVSPMVTAALGEYMQQALVMAFSGADEDTMSQLFVSIFDKKKDSMDTGTAESTLDFSCTKTDEGWKIDSVPDGAESILLSNVDKAFESMNFGGSGDSGSTDGEPENAVLNDVPLGQTLELATVSMCVTKCEEDTSLVSEYSSTDAQSGTKFVLFTVDVENITKSPITFDISDIMFYDSQKRSYNPFNDAYWYVDDSLSYAELSPNIKQTGKIIYNVPEDAQRYYFAVRKSGTDDYYRFLGE